MNEPAREFSRLKGSRELLRIRDLWIKSLNIKNKEDYLFELEMVLRGLDRFFNIENLPLSNKEQIVIRNFSNEIRIVQRYIERVVFLIKQLLEKENSSVFHFHGYVENRLLKDYAKDLFILKTITQETPRESIYILILTFLNLSEILRAIGTLPVVPYILFHNSGQLISREIAMNHFFNPFRLPAFSPVYDKITNPEILRTIKIIDDDDCKTIITVVLLALLRFLKYINFVDQNSKDVNVLKDSLLIFSLLKSEGSDLCSYINMDVPFKLKNKQKSKVENILKVLDSVSFQLNMEMKKVFSQLLRDIAQINNFSILRSNIDSAKGVLTNFFQQSVITVAQIFNTDIDGRNVFPDFVSRYEQSIRLREDIWIFIEVLEEAEKQLKGKVEKERIKTQEQILQMIQDYILYFQNLSLNLVRYTDLVSLEQFFETVNLFIQEKAVGKQRIEEFRKEIHKFKTYLQTTLHQINCRGELQNVEFNRTHAMELLSQFI